MYKTSRSDLYLSSVVIRLREHLESNLNCVEQIRRWEKCWKCVFNGLWIATGHLRAVSRTLFGKNHFNRARQNGWITVQGTITMHRVAYDMHPEIVPPATFDSNLPCFCIWKRICFIRLICAMTRKWYNYVFNIRVINAIKSLFSLFPLFLTNIEVMRSTFIV